MITGLFGVPGCGKTTMATMIASRAVKNQTKSKLYLLFKKAKRYDHIYTNFECEGCEKVDFKDLAKYKFYNSLLIFDELILDADNRDFKKFDPRIRDFFVYHRHLGNDIIYLTQAYDKIDIKIRALTQDLWYISKSVVPLVCEFSIARRIYRTIAINELTSDLVMGYRFCNLLELFFARNSMLCFRRLYYSKFDSFEEGPLETRSEFKSVFWGDSSVLPPADIIKADTFSFSASDLEQDRGEEPTEILDFFDYADGDQDSDTILSDEIPAFSVNL